MSRPERGEPALDAGWPVPWQPVWGSEDGLGSRLAGYAFLGVIEAAARVPRWMVNVWIAVLARLAKGVDRRHARAARAFLRQALGERPAAEVERRVLQSYRHFFRVLTDSQRFFRRFPGAEMLERIDLHLSEEARAVLAEPRGCLLIAGHVGNWEIALGVAPWIGLDPVYAVAKPPKNRVISRAVQRERERRRVRLLARRGAMRAAPEILRAGGAIALLLDQRARGRALLAPFFGRPARCDRSAGVLMKRHGVSALVSACTETDEPLRYRVEIYDVLRAEDVAGLDLEQITARINRAFERMILAHPDQYFWLHDRYKDTPLEPSDPALRL